MTIESESAGRRLRIAAVVLGSLVVVGALVVIALGVVGLPGSTDSARPPCERLPTVSDVRDALTSRAALAERLEAVGSGVEVSLVTPCDDPDRALVRITVPSADERAGVDAVLGAADGFGAPAEVVTR